MAFVFNQKKVQQTSGIDIPATSREIFSALLKDKNKIIANPALEMFCGLTVQAAKHNTDIRSPSPPSSQQWEWGENQDSGPKKY